MRAIVLTEAALLAQACSWSVLNPCISLISATASKNVSLVIERISLGVRASSVEPIAIRSAAVFEDMSKKVRMNRFHIDDEF